MGKMKTDLGLLLLRLIFGLTMLMAHGWPKMANFATKAEKFPALFISGEFSLGLTVFAEVFCAFAIAIGIITRLSAFPLFITMFVACFVIHGNDPFGKQEMSFLYMGGYLIIMLLGPGNFSLDRFIFKKQN